MDVNLPGHNGYECVSILKAKTWTLYNVLLSEDDEIILIV
jgi:DNA-binding NarL/FixJ family response regulator